MPVALIEIPSESVQKGSVGLHGAAVELDAKPDVRISE